MKRIGVIGIVLKNKDHVSEVNKLLSDYSDIIFGRMGFPDKETGINTISVMVKGTNEEVSALTGRLGKLDDVYVKSALTSMEVL